MSVFALLFFLVMVAVGRGGGGFRDGGDDGACLLGEGGEVSAEVGLRFGDFVPCCWAKGLEGFVEGH